MSSGPGYLKQAWYKWKSIRLPWRRQFLVGADLAGNTFWEFRDALNAGKWRRIVKYPMRVHHADVKISPQWHGWLRHTRDEAPTVQEQQHEVSRQAMMKQLAAEADERWKSTPSYLDAPEKQQPAPAIGVKDPGGYVEGQADDADAGDLRSAVGDKQEVADARGSGRSQAVGKQRGKAKEKEPSPWEKARQGAPGWQPASWTPGVAQRR